MPYQLTIVASRLSSHAVIQSRASKLPTSQSYSLKLVTRDQMLYVMHLIHQHLHLLSKMRVVKTALTSPMTTTVATH